MQEIILYLPMGISPVMSWLSDEQHQETGRTIPDAVTINVMFVYCAVNITNAETCL